MSASLLFRRSLATALPRPLAASSSILPAARRYNSTGSDRPSDNTTAALGSDSPLPNNTTSPSPSDSAAESPWASLASVISQPSGAPFGLNLTDSPFSSRSSTEEFHHLTVFATKHNTHITFSKPNKDALISVSAGNLNFRKGQRGSYEAAHQLASHVFKLIDERRYKPKAIEVVFRGFGKGREAVQKALLGAEGRSLKPLVKRVTDSTRLKFGGTRSPAHRRLG